MATLDALRKLFEEATSRVGDAVTEYERTPSPSAGEARELFGLPPAKGRVVAPLDTIPSAIARPSGVLAPLFDVTGTTGLRDYSPEQDAAWEQAPSGTQGDPLLFRKNWPLPADWTKVSDAALEDAYFAEENPPAVVQREFERRGNLLASAPSKVAPTRALARPPTARRQAPASAPAAPSTPAPVAAPQPAPVAAAPAPAPRSAAINPWATADRDFAEGQKERAETPLNRERRGLEALTGLGAGQITPALRKIIDDAVLQGYSASGAGGVETLPLGFQEAAAAARAQASEAALQAQKVVARERAVPAVAPAAVVATTPSAQAPAVEREPAASSIPVASAPTAAEAPTAATGAIAPTGPQTPAGTPDSASAATLPAPSSPGSGDDVLGRLSLGQALVRALEGSGSVIAGRDLRSGMADTLGERMRQIEALRAKRQEQAFEQQRDSAKRLEDLNAKREDRALELAREDEQSAALVEQYKSLAAQDLVPALEGLDRLPVKQAASLIKTYAGLPGTVARTDKTRAEIPLVQARTGDVTASARLKGEKAATEAVTRGPRVGLIEAKVRNEQERAGLLQRQKGLVAARVAALQAGKEKEELVKETGTVNGPLSDPKLEARRKASFLKETTAAGKLYTEPAQDLASLERVSGDFLAGRTPAWWTPANVKLLQAGVTSGLPKEALDFAKRYYAVINFLRHGLFGSALTDGEQKAFAEQIELALLRGPRDLGASLRELSAKQKAKTKLRLGYLFQDMPDLAERWLSSSGFTEAVKGTSFADTFPQRSAGTVAPASGAPAVPATSAETITIRRRSDKRIKTIPAADRAKWLANPEFEEVK